MAKVVTLEFKLRHGSSGWALARAHAASVSWPTTSTFVASSARKMKFRMKSALEVEVEVEV